MSAVYDTTRKEKKKEKELVDWTTRIGASVVTCENRRRELSSPVVLHVLLPLFLPPIRCGHLGAPSSLHPVPFIPLFTPFLFLVVSHIESARHERENQRGERLLFLEALFTTSVWLTLNRNERRRLKTRSRVIAALCDFNRATTNAELPFQFFRTTWKYKSLPSYTYTFLSWTIILRECNMSFTRISHFY